MHECGCSYLQACLLLLIAERGGHGYDLAGRLAALVPDEVDAPSTYRALRSLERAGSIASRWAPSPTGPARRVYHLTPRGEQELTGYGEQLRRDQGYVARYLDRLGTRPAAEAAPAARPATSS